MLIYMQVIEGQREKRRFEQLYTDYCGRMLTLAKRLLGNRDDAEDVVHQSFLSLAERFEKLAHLSQEQLQAYLTVVVERKSIDILRQWAKLSGAEFDEMHAPVVPPPCGNVVADAIGRLAPRYREVLLLRYGCGYSTRETGKLMDISHDAAQKLLQRAKTALRTELEKEEIRV